MQERLQATIPASSKWHNADVEEKAKELGMDKTELILKAVDMFINFDKVFLSKIMHYSKGLNLPEWLIIQNMLIKRFAEDAASYEVYGKQNSLLVEFGSVNYGDRIETITGEELFNMLKMNYITQFKNSPEYKRFNSVKMRLSKDKNQNVGQNEEFDEDEVATQEELESWDKEEG